MAADIDILVVDDTVTYRQILSKLVAEIEGTHLVGTASNGKIAFSRIALTNVDLVLLDMYMPVMDGLETLDAIKKEYPHIEVIMLSAFDEGNAKLTVKALEKGALDFIPKPSGGTMEENISKLRTALFPLMSLVKTRKFSRQARRISIPDDNRMKRPLPQKIAKTFKDIVFKPPTLTPAPTPAPAHDVKVFERPKIPIRKNKLMTQFDVVAIGVSTGGPNALMKVIPALQDQFPVPILAVQHMPPMFTASLAERLDKLSSLRVVEGSEGEIVQKGHMYIAPGGRHMIVKKGANGLFISLLDTEPVNSCRPAVDVLFHSILSLYGGNVLTVIMTGMGNDGANGVNAIRQRGGYSIIQDEESSVVWGMPGAVAKANDADEIVLLDDIAGRIDELVRKGQGRC